MPRERILVVDDAAEIREFLAHTVLAGEGYDVLTAANGEEGLILARDLLPDLIIADYLMPQMTGLDMRVALKDAEIDIPMILMTAEGSEELAVRALRAGVYDYLIKPFEADSLLTSVRSVLNRYWTSAIREQIPEHLFEANQKLDGQLQQLETLVNVGKHVTSMLDIQQVLNRVVDSAVQITGFEEGSLLLLDEQGGDLYVRAARNIDQKTVHTLRLKVQDSLAGEVVKSGQAIVLSGDELIKIQTTYFVKSVVYIPLQIDQKVIGVLSVDNRTEARTIGRNEVQLLDVLADFAAIAIENSRLYAERIQERDTLDAILRDTDDPVIIVSKDDRVLFCNPTARHVFHITMKDFVGKALGEVINNPEVLSLFSKVALNGRGRHTEILLDGGEQVFNAQLTIIDGIGRAVVMQDISHLKKVDRVKSDFVNSVAHDLRSPLTSVLGYVDMIQRVGPLDPDQIKFADKIRSSVGSISTLVGELLDLGRLEAGYDADMEPVAFDDIVRESIDSYSHQLDTQGHTLAADIADDLPPVHGNPLRLRQLINNLYGNAIKYTPPNGQITVSLQPDESVIILQVNDSGVGIPLEDQPYVFDKFYRSTNVTDEYEGTGLGLSIVKGIVEQHNGRIWLDSKEGQGTTFTVMLPVVPADPLIDTKPDKSHDQPKS